MWKVLSIFLYFIYILMYFDTSDIEASFWILFGLLLPVLCIWFSDELSNYVGSGEVAFTEKSPSILIKIVGWFILVLPLLTLY